MLSKGMANLEKSKSCISAAKDKAALKACGKDRKEMRKSMKEARELRKKIK